MKEENSQKWDRQTTPIARTTKWKKTTNERRNTSRLWLLMNVISWWNTGKCHLCMSNVHFGSFISVLSISSCCQLFFSFFFFFIKIDAFYQMCTYSCSSISGSSSWVWNAKKNQCTLKQRKNRILFLCKWSLESVAMNGILLQLILLQAFQTKKCYAVKHTHTQIAGNDARSSKFNWNKCCTFWHKRDIYKIRT